MGESVEIDLCSEKLFSNGSTMTRVLKGITQQPQQRSNNVTGTARTVNNGSTAVWFDPAWATLGDRYAPRHTRPPSLLGVVAARTSPDTFIPYSSLRLIVVLIIIFLYPIFSKVLFDDPGS